ncbi:non-ribosomal peptide synthetase [Paracoccus alkanivorans]|nr:non-ribosomal peptide synthetase [Paracoccus alkanivorans]
MPFETATIFPDSNLVPASPAQNGIWLAQQLSPDGYLFNLAEYLSLKGKLDAPVFLRSLHYLTEEAEAPRARLLDHEDGLMLEISHTYDEKIPLIDLSEEADPHEAALRWMQADLKDQDGELWRAALIRLHEDHHLWYHCAHHVLLDGFSGGLLARRCADIYTALEQGNTPPPSPFSPATTLLEADLAYRQGKRIERDRAYWIEKLSVPPEPVTLSTGGTRSGGVLRATRQLDIGESDRLRAFATTSSASLPQVMVSAFAAYVHRMTGAEDFVLAMPVMGRMSNHERAVPMMAANAVALRFSIPANGSFSDLICQCGQVMMGAMRRQKYRFEHVRRDLGMSGPVQQIASMAVNFEPFDYDLRFGDIKAEVTNLSNGSVDDLTAFIFDRGNGHGLTIVLDANPGLYTAADVERHVQRLHILLGEMVSTPESPIGETRIYLPGEAEAIARWSENGPIPTGESWLDAFEHQLLHNPGHCAVSDGRNKLSYAELDQTASRIARVLRQSNVVEGDIVALYLDRDVLLPAAILALHKMGAVYLPLDPDAPRKRNDLILGTARPKALLVSAEMPPESIHEGCEPIVLGTSLLSGEPAGWDGFQGRVTGDHLAYVIFTSGSTGTPKGVEIRHGALAALLASMRDAIGASAKIRMLAVTTIAFDIATLELLLPLTVGGIVEIASRQDTLDPDRLTARIEQAQVTHLQATPALWRIALEGDSRSIFDLTKIVGGESLPRDLAIALAAGGPLYNVYGPTETTIWSTIARIHPGFNGNPPIGRPLAGETIHILDPFGHPSPVGVTGEIWIGGVGLANGYHLRPDLTEERFRESLFGRLYRTGDFGRWSEDGQIEHLGRIDFQIKLRGYRIEAGEIEEIMRTFPGVRYAVATQSAATGALLGYFCASTDVSSTLLENHIREHLPAYMVPQRFVQLPSLPLNANGKVDIRALQSFETRACYSDRHEVAPGRAPTSTEMRVLAIAREALGRADLELEDNFFKAGGTSLSAARLVAALRREYSTNIALASIFAAQDLRAFAREIEEIPFQDPLSAVLHLRQSTGYAPTLFCIHPVLGIGWGYAALLQALPEEVGLCVLQSPGLTEPAVWPDLRTMAQEYLETILNEQPDGPYHLVGWSFGGLTAQEIAAQLEARQKRVATLCLLDAYPFHPGSWSIHEHDRIQQTLIFMGEHPDPNIRTIEELVARIATRPEIEALRVNQGSNRFEQLRARIQEVAETNLELAQRHIPKRITAPILDFCATEGKTEMLSELLDWQDGVWEAHSRSGATRIAVACSHNDMLGPASIATILPYLIGKSSP